MPELERENPQRNDALLNRIADETRREVLHGHAGGAGQGGRSSRWSNLLKDRTNDRADHRRPQSAVGGDVAPLADDRAVRRVVPGMVDPAIVQIGVTTMKMDAIRERTAIGPRRPGDARRPAPADSPLIWIEGLAAAVAWLGAAFWVSLAIDWLFEPPAVVRALVLAAAAIALAAVLVG